VCLGIEGIEPQPVLLGLDAAGVAVHSGSSCSTESLEPSPVLEAMGVDADRSLRVSVGWNSTDDDIDLLLRRLPEVLERLRSLRSA
jgi:cysteine desulfurase